ncbi:MFS transporter [Hoeflea sp.]|uniref:MFS transporter n=1 Tax=Hoeflea sp. TaxID=1940281 RepID=UPI003BB08A2C
MADELSGGNAMSPGQKSGKRGIYGWMMFDWAAQPFFTVVTTFIFGPYFISRMASDPAAGQAAWGYGIAAGGFLIAVLSPVLGSIADQTGPRKPWIAFFAILKILALCGLWFAAPGSSLVAVVALFTLASVAAEFSIVFNDSMLLRIVPKSDIGRVSNLAWGMGYLGGMIVLIFIIACLAASPETGRTIIGMEPLFGLDPLQGEDARASGPISALWYAVFILPMFLFTPDAGGRRAMGTAVREGLAELKSTIGEVRQRAGIFRFLIARMIYQDGVNALLALGGGFAAAMFGWSITEIGIYGILLNIVAIFSCLYASRLDTRLGSKIVVLISIAMLLFATIGIVSTGPGFTLFGALAFGAADSGGLFGTAAEKAYILFGLFIGIAFGPVQASSRAYMARSVSEEEAGRFFGLYALAGRATSFLAPFMVATVTAASGSPRLGMATIILFFAAGLWILWTTPYPADRPDGKPATDLAV